jgi:hypothetical protein
VPSTRTHLCASWVGSKLGVVATWIPFIGAVLAAVLAGRYALRAKTAEFQANRILELERRLAASKAEVFEPMVEALMQMFELTAQGKASDEAAFEEVAGPAFRKFVHWVQVYGSDETVRVVHKMMQALYSAPPPEIVLHFVAELIVAARRELGHPDTQIDAVDVMGIRINDLYSGDGSLYTHLALPEAELFKKLGWSPPWGDRFESAPEAASS